MIINKIVVGKFGVNCYFVMCEKTKEAVIIDPGDQANVIMRTVEEHNAKVKYILLTHGHGDHIGAVNELKSLTDASIVAAEEELDMLSNADYNESIRIGDKAITIDADWYVRDKEKIKFGTHTMTCIKTPGHTKGGMCFLVNDELFSGDTLFMRSVGRADLYGGDFNTLINSITSRLMVLKDNINVYPGHGPKTTIGFEKKNNQFL